MLSLKIVHSDTHTVVIICLFNGIIEGVQYEDIPEKQRLTFVWTYEENRLQLIHMHMSNSLKLFDETQDLQAFQATKVTRQVKNIINLNENEPLLSFKDTKHLEHMVSPSEIVCVEAFNQYVELHCTRKDIRIKASLSEIEEELPRQFLKVHRSYIINVMQVEQIQSRIILMRDEREIPIPVKKTKEIVEQIRELQRDIII